MDDNPWGRDPSPIMTPAKPSSPPLPVQLLDPPSSHDDSPEITPANATESRGDGWAHADEEDSARDNVVADAGHAHVKEVERIGAALDQGGNKQEKETGGTTTPDLPHEQEVEHDTAPTLPPPSSTLSPPMATSHAILSIDQDQGPPMDDFDDDESPAPTPAGDSATTNGAVAAMDAFDDDDFDDFGEAAGAGEGGADDDDFGDFGGDDDAFGAASPVVVPVAVAAAAVPATPVASTSGLPPLRLDFSNPTKEALVPQLANFLAELYPGADRAVSDEPERQVEGIGQVLVGESSRGLLAQLSSLPPLRPLDWRRSKIRREHLIALGVPVNLDDVRLSLVSRFLLNTFQLTNLPHDCAFPQSADAKPLASLVLPSLRTASPILRSSSPSRASAPAGSLSPLPFTSSSPHPSRPSTPSEERRKLASIPPPLDRKRAKEIVAMQQDDLTLLNLKELKGVKEEIEKISMEASEVLTHALLMREKEVGDGETYHGMIQDLVSAAARMKTTSASLSRSGSNSTSTSRWGRKSSGNQNAPSPVR